MRKIYIHRKGEADLFCFYKLLTRHNCTRASEDEDAHEPFLNMKPQGLRETDQGLACR